MGCGISIGTKMKARTEERQAKINPFREGLYLNHLNIHVFVYTWYDLKKRYKNQIKISKNEINNIVKKLTNE